MIKYLLPFLLICSSCVDASFYEENVTVTGRAWTYNQKPKFNIRITDNTSKYNLYINIRHTGEYDYSNIFILLHEKGPSIPDSIYRKEIKLAELDGRWLGKSAGTLYETQYLAKENFTFPDTGVYTFTLEQNMRENPLRDVEDIGIKLVKE